MDMLLLDHQAPPPALRQRRHDVAHVLYSSISPPHDGSTAALSCAHPKGLRIHRGDFSQPTPREGVVNLCPIEYFCHLRRHCHSETCKHMTSPFLKQPGQRRTRTFLQHLESASPMSGTDSPPRVGPVVYFATSTSGNRDAASAQLRRQGSQERLLSLYCRRCPKNILVARVIVQP